MKLVFSTRFREDLNEASGHYRQVSERLAADFGERFFRGDDWEGRGLRRQRPRYAFGTVKPSRTPWTASLQNTRRPPRSSRAEGNLAIDSPLQRRRRDCLPGRFVSGDAERT